MYYSMASGEWSSGDCLLVRGKVVKSNFGYRVWYDTNFKSLAENKNATGIVSVFYEYLFKGKSKEGAEDDLQKYNFDQVFF